MDRVEPGPAVVLRNTPAGVDPAPLLKPQQGGVYGALVQTQYILAHLLNAARDPEPMLRAQRMKGLQNHQVERALQFLRLVSAHSHSFGHCKEGSTAPFECP